MGKYYITKYALTKGIIEVNGEICGDAGISVSDNMLEYKVDRTHTYSFKPYWHGNIENAVMHANNMREKKILSLKKQILKLEKLSFMRTFLRHKKEIK